MIDLVSSDSSSSSEDEDEHEIKEETDEVRELFFLTSRIQYLTSIIFCDVMNISLKFFKVDPLGLQCVRISDTVLSIRKPNFGPRIDCSDINNFLPMPKTVFFLVWAS